MLKEEQQKDERSLDKQEYRIVRYTEMGFLPDQCVELSKLVGTDPSSVREKFLKRGCSPELAYRIIGP